MAILEARKVSRRFGGLTAVDGMDFELEAGTIAGIIGPNGAGKTTFFNALTGIIRPDEGSIRIDGRSIVGLRPDQITALRVARTFQNIRLFGGMTVLENIMVGMYTRQRQNLFGILLRSDSFREEEDDSRARALELMKYVGLGQESDEPARNLPYGGQRRVEIARALACEPRLLLLDEPTAGMNPHEKDQAVFLYRRIAGERGITVLLIEHDMRVVMDICQRITVMDHGHKIAEGTPPEIRSNERVIEAYLGRGAAVELAGGVEG